MQIIIFAVNGREVIKDGLRGRWRWRDAGEHVQCRRGAPGFPAAPGTRLAPARLRAPLLPGCRGGGWGGGGPRATQGPVRPPIPRPRCGRVTHESRAGLRASGHTLASRDLLFPASPFSCSPYALIQAAAEELRPCSARRGSPGPWAGRVWAPCSRWGPRRRPGPDPWEPWPDTEEGTPQMPSRGGAWDGGAVLGYSGGTYMQSPVSLEEGGGGDWLEGRGRAQSEAHFTQSLCAALWTPSSPPRGPISDFCPRGRHNSCGLGSHTGGISYSSDGKPGCSWNSKLGGGRHQRWEGGRDAIKDPGSFSPFPDHPWTLAMCPLACHLMATSWLPQLQASHPHRTASKAGRDEG